MAWRFVDPVVALYRSEHALVLYDEEVTEIDHALQTAGLARAGGADERLVASALLHDIGHLLVRDLRPLDAELVIDHRHDQIGADYLEGIFGAEIADPVRLHVAAKRYLCSVESGYRATLSPSSVRSLAVQGGPMTAAEAREFERLPAWRRAVLLRRWDEQAKVGGLEVAPLDSWLMMLASLAG